MSESGNTQPNHTLEATQSKPSFSTLRNTHRRNREEIQDIFFNRKKLLPENKGLMSDTAKHATRKELEGDLDSLTGLYNKNGFNKRLQETVSSVARNKEVLYGVVFDADGLKAINDEQGHKAGDEYIRKIGGVFNQNLRSGDFVGRTGGDEFIAVLKISSEEDLETWWKNRNQLFIQSGIKISGGAFKLDLDNPNTSLETADQAMYAAKLNKANGENNFMIAIKENDTINYRDVTSRSIGNAA